MLLLSLLLLRRLRLMRSLRLTNLSLLLFLLLLLLGGQCLRVARASRHHPFRLSSEPALHRLAAC
jgi:hypothetical protein